MARIKNNFAMVGITGKVGDIFVYRQRNGKTIVARTPNRTAPLSQKQKDQTKRFKAAITYAQNALLDPSLKEYYNDEAKRKTNMSPYNAAVADYLTAPVIINVDTSQYTGEATAQKITFEVENSNKVISVKVSIIAKNKSTIEEGIATLSKGKWTYSTTSINTEKEGAKIIINATDRPGNTAKKEIVL